MLILDYATEWEKRRGKKYRGRRVVRLLGGVSFSRAVGIQDVLCERRVKSGKFGVAL
jgi:hypothetical protein